MLLDPGQLPLADRSTPPGTSKLIVSAYRNEDLGDRCFSVHSICSFSISSYPVFSRFFHRILIVFPRIRPRYACLTNTDEKEIAAEQLVRNNRSIDQSVRVGQCWVTSAHSGLRYSLAFLALEKTAAATSVSCDEDATDCCLQASTALTVVVREHSENNMPRSTPYITHLGVTIFARSLYCTG